MKVLGWGRRMLHASRSMPRSSVIPNVIYWYHVPEVLRDRPPLHYVSYAAVPPAPCFPGLGIRSSTYP